MRVPADPDSGARMAGRSVCSVAGALIREQLGRSCGKTLGGALMAGKSVCSEHRG